MIRLVIALVCVGCGTNDWLVAESTPSCSSAGHTCCNRCDGGAAHASLDGTCTGQVCCAACWVHPIECVEAEAGELEAPMAQIVDADASGGALVATSVMYQGAVTFSFDVLAAGAFVLHARVYAPPPVGAHNSFYVSVDGAAAAEEDVFHIPADATELTWIAVNRWGIGNGTGGPEIDPMVWQLAPGPHTFSFLGRETDAQLDQVALRPCETDDCTDVTTLGCLG